MNQDTAEREYMQTHEKLIDLFVDLQQNRTIIDHEIMYQIETYLLDMESYMYRYGYDVGYKSRMDHHLYQTKRYIL